MTGGAMSEEKISVLVIDDSDDARALVEYHLREEGFTVFSANNGELGLALAEEYRPAVILLDVMMPGMDGLSVLKELKKESSTKDIVVFMLSLRRIFDDIKEAYSLGADGYIVKPFEPKELGELIRNKLETLGKQH